MEKMAVSWKQMRRANELQWKIILTVLHERFGAFNTKKVDAVIGAATLSNMQLEAGKKTQE